MNPGGRIILLGPHEDQIQLYLRPFLTKEVYLTGVNLGNASVNDLLETARFLSDHRKQADIEIDKIYHKYNVDYFFNKKKKLLSKENCF